jgi:hypothetical protein
MNRHQRHRAKTKGRKGLIALDQVHSTVDVWFESKGQLVMIVANSVGQKAAEELWPDVQWSRDAKSASMPPDWQWTHIRVTKLPSYLEAKCPLVFASGDSLAFAAAFALHYHAPHLSARIGWFTGDMPKAGDIAPGIEFHKFSGPVTDREHPCDLFAEYVPAGTVIGAPQSMN